MVGGGRLHLETTLGVMLPMLSMICGIDIGSFGWRGDSIEHREVSTGLELSARVV